MADQDDANILQALSRILEIEPGQAERNPTKSLISLSVRRGGLGVRLSRDHHLGVVFGEFRPDISPGRRHGQMMGLCKNLSAGGVRLSSNEQLRDENVRFLPDFQILDHKRRIGCKLQHNSSPCAKGAANV